MNKNKNLIVCCLIAFLLIGCGTKKNLFVLMPDPDGKVGKIIVKSPKGTQSVSDAGYATGLDSADEAPSAPAPMEKEQISQIFGAALAAQPEPPVIFILYFEENSNKLTKKSLNSLSEILATIKFRKSMDISIVGHTDRIGSEDYNLRLSLDRALKVRDFLISMGVDSDNLEITSHGEENPLIQTDDNVAEPLNRRVEVTIR